MSKHSEEIEEFKSRSVELLDAKEEEEGLEQKLQEAKMQTERLQREVAEASHISVETYETIVPHGEGVVFSLPDGDLVRVVIKECWHEFEIKDAVSIERLNTLH